MNFSIPASSSVWFTSAKSIPSLRERFHHASLPPSRSSSPKRPPHPAVILEQPHGRVGPIQRLLEVARLGHRAISIAGQLW